MSRPTFGKIEDINKANQNTSYYKDKLTFYEFEGFGDEEYEKWILSKEQLIDTITSSMEYSHKKKIAFTISEVEMTQNEFDNIQDTE